MMKKPQNDDASASRRVLVMVASLALVMLGVLLPQREAGAKVAGEIERRQVLDAYGRLPLALVENRGQGAAGSAFVLNAAAHSLQFRRDGHLLILAQGQGDAARAHTVRVELVGAETVAISGEQRAPGVVSFFNGTPAQWRTGLPIWSGIRYSHPWPGIDLSYRGDGGRLESIYTVAPHADPKRIKLRYTGQDALAIDDAGNLVYDTPLGRVSESAPVLYQDIDGRRVHVNGRYRLLDEHTVAFHVSRYDRRHALVIDPTLTYSGFIGGVGDDEAFDVDVDAAGNAYVTGYTSSTQTTFPVVVGPDLTHNAGTNDAFVAKISPDGMSLLYLGYIGGNGTDLGRGIAVDAAGNAYVTGYGNSTQFSFPLVVGPGSEYGGGTYDAWVVKINPAGTALLYAGFIGGNGDDLGLGIDVDSNGAAYVTGNTTSHHTSFPVLVGPDLTTNGSQDGFVAKVSPSGATLIYAGFIGGTGLDRSNAIAVDADGYAYVTGPTASNEASFPVTFGPDLTHNGGDDAFVAKVSVDGSALVYAGYIGGSSNDRGNGIAVDIAGNAYVTGLAASTQTTFPVLVGPDLVHNGGDDAFVAKVAADGAALLYCGYIGGASTESGTAIAVNSAGEAYVVGGTFSNQASFPVLEGPDLTHNGATDIFVAKVDADGSALQYAGYLGGNGGDPGTGIAVDDDGNAYVTGTAASNGGSFPVVAGPDLSSNGAIDAFVARVSESSNRIFRDHFE